jgi:tetratricopeptide (TPR) repeat protein
LNRHGDVLVAQGNLPEALKSYQADLAIADRLAKADPGNAGWQRDLSVSYAKLAGAFRKAGDKTKALDALRQGRAIMVRMTSLSPDNPVWKRDLASFDGQIAELAHR